MLKGALLLKTIGIPRARPTMDIDMLRKGKADQASLIALVKDCATIDVETDGLMNSTSLEPGAVSIVPTAPVLSMMSRPLHRMDRMAGDSSACASR